MQVQETNNKQTDGGGWPSLSKASHSQEDVKATNMITSKEMQSQVVKEDSATPKKMKEPEECCEPILDLTPIDEFLDSTVTQKKNEQK